MLPASSEDVFEAKSDGKGNFASCGRRSNIIGAARGGGRGILVSCFNRCAVDFVASGSCKRKGYGFYHLHQIGDVVTHLSLSHCTSISLGPAGPALESHVLFEATRPTGEWAERTRCARSALRARQEEEDARSRKRKRDKPSGWDSQRRQPRQQRSGQRAHSQSHRHLPSSHAHADAGASKNYNTSGRSGVRPNADNSRWEGDLLNYGFSIKGLQDLAKAAGRAIAALEFGALQAAAHKEYLEKQRTDLLAFQEAMKKMDAEGVNPKN